MPQQRTVQYPQAGNKIQIEVGRTDKGVYIAEYIVTQAAKDDLTLKFQDVKFFKKDLPI